MSEPTRPLLDVTVIRSQLTAALKAVNTVVPRKAALPVLQHVRLATRDGRLEISGTDLDAFLSIDIEIEPVGPACVVIVPGRALADLIKSLPAKQAVRLTETEEAVGKETRISLQVSSGSMVSKLPALPVPEFPFNGYGMEFTNPIEVSGPHLAALMTRTGPFASTEESRPILNGVLLELGKLNGHQFDPAIRAVATNGHRLSMATVAAPSFVAPKEPWSFILPPVAVNAITAVEMSDVVYLSWDVQKAIKRVGGSYIPASKVLRVGGAGFTLTTRLIEGPYPHYQQVIPRENDKTALFTKAELAGVLNRMKAVTSKQTHRIRVSFNGHCEISATTPDTGTVTERITAHYWGDPLEIGFNAEYMAGLLKVIPTDRVRFTFSQPERAAILTPVDEVSDIEHKALLMPLRLID